MPMTGGFTNQAITGIGNPNTLAAAAFNAGLAYVDAFGSLGVYERATWCGQTTDTLSDPGVWTITQTGTASVSDGGQMFVLNSGTQSNTGCSLQSVKQARFMLGTISSWGAGIAFPGQVLPPKGIQITIGALTATNGVALRWQDGQFQILTRLSGADTITTAFNGQLPPTEYYLKGVTWTILYTANAALVYCGTFLIHTFFGSYTGAATLPLFASVNNTTNTVPYALQIDGWAIQTLGLPADMRPFSTFINVTTPVLCKHGPGGLRSVLIGHPVSAGTCTVYDSLTATGTILASLSWQANSSPIWLPLDYDFQIGLTIQSTAAVGITIAIT